MSQIAQRRASAGRTINPWQTLAVVCAAYFMIQLDTTIVYIAVPSIENDLGFTPSGLQWVSNAYLLVYGGLLLLGGRLTDLYGRRRVFMIGVTVFALASLGNGLAVSPGMMIGFRAVQGIGGALCAPAALSIVNTTFPDGNQRTRALGVWGATAGGGAGAGFLAGGLLSGLLGWEWVFFVNLPISAALLITATRLVPVRDRDTSRGRPDLAGAVAVTAGLATLVYALVGGRDAGWASAQTLGWLTVALALLAGFVVIEHRRREPLVRLGILTVRAVAVANSAIILAQAALFGFFYLGSLYFQHVLGYSPLQTGLALLIFPVGLMLSIQVAQRLIPRTGVKPVLLAGLLLVALGLGLLSMLAGKASFVGAVLPGLIPLAIGAGGTIMPLTLTATSQVDPAEQGLASGLFTTSTQIGGALGIAILTTLAASRPGIEGYVVSFAVAATLALAACLLIAGALRREPDTDTGVPGNSAP